MLILVINPGSTSTKIAVYNGRWAVVQRSIAHTTDELARFKEVVDQFDFRRQLILDCLEQNGIAPVFQAVIGRGGLGRPLEGGVYEVSQKMLDDTRQAAHHHACDLGCLLASDLARLTPGCRALIADPGTVDELAPQARLTGLPQLPHTCIWHALNQRAVARRFAAETGHRYEELNLIVCHMGGGISVAVHEQGKAVDANNALDGEGPFSPDRAGTLPAADLIRLCFSGQYTEQQLLRLVSGGAGLTAHLGTNDMREITARIEAGDRQAALVVDAMVWQTAKAIAAGGAVLCGRVDAILLTGGLAKSDYVVTRLRKRIAFLAPVHCYPGENEMEALAMNALEVLKGHRKAKTYG